MKTHKKDMAPFWDCLQISSLLHRQYGSIVVFSDSLNMLTHRLSLSVVCRCTCASFAATAICA